MVVVGGLVAGGLVVGLVVGDEFATGLVPATEGLVVVEMAGGLVVGVVVDVAPGAAAWGGVDRRVAAASILQMLRDAPWPPCTR